MEGSAILGWCGLRMRFEQKEIRLGFVGIKGKEWFYDDHPAVFLLSCTCIIDIKRDHTRSTIPYK